MGSVIINEGRYTLEVKNKEGEVLKVFEYATGNYEQMQTMVDSASEIEEIISGLSEEPTHEKLKMAQEMLEKQISAILGPDGWGYFWNHPANPHNITLCVSVLKEISSDMIKEMREQNKGYV